MPRKWTIVLTLTAKTYTGYKFHAMINLGYVKPLRRESGISEPRGDKHRSLGR